MDIRQLKYFVTVVEEKTVTAAAKKLNMTQPPLTAQLHLLEEELGCSLFRHEGRRIVPTEGGEHLYRRALEILGMCESVKQEMADFKEGAAGTLRIGVISSIQGTLFSDWLKEYGKRCPNVSISIQSANTYQLLERVQSREIDIALIRTPFAGQGMDILRLRREPMMAVGDRKYFQGMPESGIGISALEHAPLIVYRRSKEIIESGFEAACRSPYFFCVNDDAAMTIRLAAEGLGVGLVPYSALSKPVESEMEVRTILADTLESEIVLACQNRHTLPQTALMFWQLIEQMEKDTDLRALTLPKAGLPRKYSR